MITGMMDWSEFLLCDTIITFSYVYKKMVRFSRQREFSIIDWLIFLFPSLYIRIGEFKQQKKKKNEPWKSYRNCIQYNIYT